MVRQGAILMSIGFEQFQKLSRAQKEKISEALGTTGGGTLGFASITAVISSLGVPGLSAAGISSGLAALGSFIGGMAAGIVVAAAIPVVAAALDYGLIKAIKWGVGEVHVNSHETELDPYWEIEKYTG
jgi:hypothetical protein